MNRFTVMRVSSDDCKHDVISGSLRSTYSSLSETTWCQTTIDQTTINQITRVPHHSSYMCGLLLSWQMITDEKGSSFVSPSFPFDCTYCTVSVLTGQRGWWVPAATAAWRLLGQKQQQVICKVADGGTMGHRIRDRNQGGEARSTWWQKSDTGQLVHL